MGIEVTNDGTIIATGEGIEVMRLLHMHSALRLEVRTGMKASRVNVANLIRETIGSKTRSKAKLLKEFDAVLRQAGLNQREI